MIRRSLRPLPPRPNTRSRVLVALMMPAVTLLPRPIGLPIAMTHWPTLRSSDLPHSSATSPSGSILMTAASVFGSLNTF